MAILFRISEIHIPLFSQEKIREQSLQLGVFAASLEWK